jgi:DNA-binding transcriptional LysR family regulator
MLDYPGLSIQHLRYFITIAELGSMSQAAEILHATPSALSQNIAHLEEIIEIQLFYRSKQRLYLTDAGRRLLIEFKDIKSRLYHALDSERERMEEKRVLTIGFTNYHEESVDIILDEFQKMYPGLDFSVEILVRNKLQMNFLDKKIDIIVILDFERLHQEKEIISKVVSMNKMGCYMSHALPISRKENISWKDLNGMVCILPEYQRDSAFLQDLIKKCSKEKIKVSIQFHDGDIITISKFVMYNKCITFARHKAFYDNRLKSFVLPDFEYPVIISYHADANRNTIKYAKAIYNIYVNCNRPAAVSSSHQSI